MRTVAGALDAVAVRLRHCAQTGRGRGTAPSAHGQARGQSDGHASAAASLLREEE